MKTKTILLAGVIIATATGVQARDQIRIVGSSTVFPFSSAVAENFGKTTNFKTPIVESTGSGGGLKLFCSGIGTQHPDITNASRRIKSSEVKRCAKNGIKDIVEMKVGYDGIVIANSKKSPLMKLTRKQVWMALAKDVPNSAGKMIPNPYKNWSDVDPSLPRTRIEVLGPPPTSGTRDAFVELAMEGGCKKFPAIKNMRKTNKKKYKAICHSIREDGAFIEAGENDNLIVQKLNANPKAFGVFGYSFLDQNSDTLQGGTVDGVAPEFEAISSGKYPVSRALYFYVKKAHVGVVPGIAEYLNAFASEKAWGLEGYLADKGLIPMKKDERSMWADSAKNLKNLSM